MLSKKSVVAGLVMMFVLTNASAADHTIMQNSKSFKLAGSQIEEMTIKAGDTIHFKNEDPFFHNIFSLSDLKTFDLGSYPAGESKAVVFDAAGEVEVECAIHPQMYLLLTVE
ncbi:MAG: hypothetical protein COB33_009595 [Thiotrichaceae bacterium]|nr:hypothetical protein [Thiotrichaceae bacterium]PCI12768.1 MAG: methylamine utilization protein [Thiotrichales bacterium]